MQLHLNYFSYNGSIWIICNIIQSHVETIAIHKHLKECSSDNPEDKNVLVI
mgnify:CR=1 FL=1